MKMRDTPAIVKMNPYTLWFLKLKFLFNTTTNISNQNVNDIPLVSRHPFTYNLIPTCTSCTNNKRNNRLIGIVVFIQSPK